MNTDNAQRSIDDFQLHIHDPNRPLYKYATFEATKSILKSGQVWFRPPTFFNDPFEFHPGFLDNRISQKEFKVRVKQEYQHFFPHLSQQEINGIVEGISIDNYKDARIQAIDKQRKVTLLFCTAQSHMKTLMWSHYSDSHKGFCIGIKIPSVSPNMVSLKVRYVEDVQPIRLLSLDQDEQNLALRTWMFSKSRDWTYEEEVRTILISQEYDELSGKGYKEVNLLKEMVVEIYAGIQTPSDQINEIKQIIKEKEYPIEKSGRMKLRSNAFALEIVSL